MSRVTVPAENYDAVEKYRRFLCSVALNLAVILWVGSSICIISIYVWSSWRPNSADLWFPSISLGLWWMYGWLEGVNMEIIITDRICQNFPFKFHRNLYRLYNFSRLLPLSKWIQVLFSALRDIKLPRQSCLSFNIFMVTLYFLVLRGLSQSYCLKQLDSEDRVNLVLPIVGNYRPEADCRMPKDLSLNFSQQLFQIPSVRTFPV